MQYFNFARLVQKYSSSFTVIIPGEKELNDSGDWVKSEPKEVELFGAIIGRGESKAFRSNGTLTEKDKRLFMLEPIDKALLGTQIQYEDDIFRIQSSAENGKYTGVWAYVLKFVSAFKDGIKE